MIDRQAAAIVWAQWRSVMNYHGRRKRGGFPLAIIFGLFWYGFWALTAAAVAISVADPDNVTMLKEVLPGGLLTIFTYWQVVPILMVSTGVSLDLMRLLVYPIRHGSLFGIEVVLRITTCLEMLLISAGLCVGILLNPRLPAWGVLAMVVFACFNLFVSAGIKDVLGRLLARKGVREVAVLLLVLLAALPQLLLAGGPSPVGRWITELAGGFSPWGSAAQLSLGTVDAASVSILIIWTAAAWYFGRTQFERSLHFDASEVNAPRKAAGLRARSIDFGVRSISRFLPDPLAVLVEKEVRCLSRSARFRLLFLMGFSFGLLIWLPMVARGEPESFLATNYLTLVNSYALMLLGEVCFWNNFGLDRGAAQGYFAMPALVATALRAKNIAAVFFILLELVLVTLVCLLLRMPMTLERVGEAVAVTLTFAVFLLSFGNLISVRHPRPINPAKSWSSGSVGRTQAYLLLLYPAAAAPIALAFGAQYAFESGVAFYSVLLVDLILGLVLYSIALESAAATAESNKEAIVLALSKAEGPLGS